MINSTKSLKKDFRLSVKKYFSEVSSEELSNRSHAIQKNLKLLIEELKAQKSVTIVGSYKPLKFEPQLQHPFTDESLQLCYPKVEEQQLTFWTAVQSWKCSSLGVLEPEQAVAVQPYELQALVIPGLAFSQKGVRLGRGQGFYDRYLTSFKGIKIGVCFELNLFNEIPQEDHDILMDFVVTEKNIFKISSTF